ncbi:MAG: GTPase Era [Deltaproteobacteria bacterium]|nr:MAG: GTPase Era [Deltaproteobacteria bacterium]
MINNNFKSGFIAIIGRPNVGKSTLLNKILGKKIAIISPKPQTTRNRILGVKSLPQAQLVFLDTPGIHRVNSGLSKRMVITALTTLQEVNLVLHLVEPEEYKWGKEDFILEKLSSVNVPIFLLINKIDTIIKENLLPLIKQCDSLGIYQEILPISALDGEGIDLLIDNIIRAIPCGPRYFPEDMISDQMERFLVAEIIREKIFKLTEQEIPYSTAVLIEEFKEREEKELISIRALINVERDSQKGIIIGKQGKMIRKIGEKARLELEKLLGTRIYLDLFVKVQKDWSKDPRALREFGYQ